MRLKCACRCEKEIRMRIPFVSTGSAGPVKGASDISNPRLFLREKLSDSLSLSLLSPWMQVQVGDYRYRLSPPLISRTTVLRNTGNWHPRETRKEWEEKKTWEWAETVFYDNDLYDFPVTRGPWDRKIDERSVERHRRNIVKRCILQEMFVG